MYIYIIYYIYIYIYISTLVSLPYGYYVSSINDGIRFHRCKFDRGRLLSEILVT